MFVIPLSFCLALAGGPVFADDDDDAESAARLEQLRVSITRLRSILEKVRTKKSRVQNDLRRMEKSISRINRKLRKIRRDIRKQKKNLGRLYRQRTELQAGLKRHRTMLGKQVRASYVMGRQEQLKIVLNQGDPSTVKRALVYFDYLNRSRAEHIQGVIKRLKQLQEVENRIVAEKKMLETLLAEQGVKKKELVKARKGRKKILLALTREIKTKDKKLDRMLQDERELRRVLKAVEQALIDIPAKDLEGKPFAARKGELPWPASGRLLASFGGRRSVGRLKWNGVMIAAARGVNVRVVARGRVAFSDWLRGYGLMVIIDHGDGYMSLYGHNQSLFKEIGEWVEEGDIIASVGNSGGQSRSQLYFELRHKGVPVNPAIWCRRTRRGFASLR